MITVNINGLSLCHKGSGGISHNTLPDVCKTPPFGTPIPYENEAYSSDLVKGTVSVFADGGNMIANVDSQFARSVFDELGSMGGIISGTNKAEAEWISHSFDVFFEKKPACRLTDKMFMNHRNTACLGGELQDFLDNNDIKGFKDKICEWAKECYLEYCGGGLGPKSSGAKYAHYQDCLNDKIENDAYEYDPEKKKTYPTGDTAKELSFKPVDGKSTPIYPRGNKLGKWGEWGIEATENLDVTDLGTPSGRRRMDLVVKFFGKIKYLFDIKFPDDGFTSGQEEAYKRIAKDIGAEFKPFYLEEECPDWPEKCPNEKKEKLSQEEIEMIQKAIQSDIQRQMYPQETDWALIGLIILASAATLCPFDGPAGDVAAWSAVGARWGTRSAPAL